MTEQHFSKTQAPEKRRFWLDWGGTTFDLRIAVVVIATATVVLFLILNGLDNQVDNTTERLTIIERGSPCTTSPGTAKCEAAISGVVSTITPKQALILNRKIQEAKRGE
jgi:hypothetical protein